MVLSFQGAGKGNGSEVPTLIRLKFIPVFGTISKFQQFVYGVVREGVIAEHFPQISAKYPETFRRISASFLDAIKFFFFPSFLFSRKLSAEYP